jgi:prepilin-type N-terminal cleavage/methylation domain-containing protein
MHIYNNNIRWCEQGFTLLELIGVLAVIAILAAVITPNVIKQIQTSRQDAEEEALSLLADGLKNFVLENRIIPLSGYGSGTWSANIASQTDLPEKKVYQNDLNCSRRYWFDPSTNLNGLSTGSASYNQNTVSAANLSSYTTGSTAAPPVNPRAMIISDMTPGCTNNINGVSNTSANFTAVWNQANSATDPLVEGKTLKIERINFSQLFKTVTLHAGNESISSRRSYTNPSSSAPTVDYPLITAEKNSHIFSISYSSGGFEPTNIPGGTATLDIGRTSGGNEFVSAANVTSGVTSSSVAVTYTSSADISIGSELTMAGAGVLNGNSGYIDIVVEYNGEPQYRLEGQAGNPATISITSPGTPEIVSFNVIDGTTLYLYDQSWTAGSPAGDMLLTVVIKESAGFTYSPGPPTSWSR